VGIVVALIALLGVVTGGLVAGGFALVTGMLEGRRQHRRWVNEKRFAAYADLTKAVDEYALGGDGAPALLATATVNLLGPDWLLPKAEDFLQAARVLGSTSKTHPKPESSRLVEFRSARGAFVVGARYALGVPADSKTAPPWDRDIAALEKQLSSMGASPDPEKVKRLVESYLSRVPSSGTRASRSRRNDEQSGANKP
jgi:hypothetical protein